MNIPCMTYSQLLMMELISYSRVFVSTGEEERTTTVPSSSLFPAFIFFFVECDSVTLCFIK